MGKSESAITHIGIRIQIKDLVNAINEENRETIQHQFLSEDSMVEDCNGHYNSTYTTIIYGEHIQSGPVKPTHIYSGGEYKSTSPESIDMEDFGWKEYKEYLLKMFQKFGDEAHSYDDSFRNINIEICEYKENDENNLFNQYLLIPRFKLVDTARWGYHRSGTNSTATVLDITKLTEYTNKINEEMKNLNFTNYEVVLISMIHSG